MAYIGLRPVTNFLSTFSQKFSGNNSTLQFILSRAVSRAEDLEVFVGSTQILPGAYTAKGNELTFVSAPATGTDNITVIFRAGAIQSVEIGSTGFPAGSAASPGVFFADGVNTGLFWPSVSSVAVSALGVRRVEISSATDATSTTTGALQVAGGVGATGNLFTGGIVRFTDATESDGVSSGAVVISGGVGIAKNLNVNGDIQVTGDFTVAGTFTTTASDSLAINDPFLFLATNNTGDSLDTGFVSKYVDGALVNRYSGFFRDVTDGVYKVFANLTVEPSTTVNTDAPSFELSDFAARNISAAGSIQALSGAAATSTTTGALRVTGGVGITGDLYAASLDLTSGNIATTGFLSNVAGINASGVVRTTGILYANSDINSSSTTTGALVVNGGIGATGNVTVGNLSATNLTGTVRTAAQPSITSVGSLTALTVSGAVTMSATTAAINIHSSQTTGAFILGGTGATGAITLGRSTGDQTVNLATGATTSGNTKVLNIGTAGLSGSTTNINIGSAVAGSTTAVTLNGNVTAGNVNATNLTGTLLTASQTNITAVGTLTSGTWNATTIATSRGGTGLTSFNTNGALYATSTSALTTGTLPVASGGTGITSFGAGIATFLGTPSSANLAAAVTDETGSGALVFGTSPTFTTQITTPAIVKSGTNGTGNIGQSANSYNTIFAKATSAQYADVAERYLADADYEPGTVLHFGGDYEVSQCNADACTRVAGVVSTNPAYIMNSQLEGEHVVEVALLGRVPCKVEGTVQRGDMMVSAGNGRARAEANPKLGTVIGKALENFNGEVGVIEVVVGRS
jgi:hypothetical protein